MIKIDDGKFYMTLGEGCYVLREDNGHVRPVCFGARVEPEDDMTALDEAFPFDDPALDEFDCADGYVFERAEVVQKPLCAFPVLRGDKTLKLTFADETKKLEQTLYYTPYSRGGIARRTEIKNNGTRAVKVKSLGLSFRLPAVELITRCGNNFVLGSVRDNVAYGFCMLYGGEAEFYIESVSGGTVVTYAPRLDTPVTLAAGEALSSPEILVAYSDLGTDGMSRILHDLLRERALPQTVKRRPLVAEHSFETAAKLRKSAALAAELGCDTLLSDVTDEPALSVLSETCKALHIRAGLKLKFDGDTKKLFSMIEKYSIGYLMIESEADGDYMRAGALYKLYAELNSCFPELVIEGRCGDLGALCYCMAVGCGTADALKYSVYFPPCSLACRLAPQADSLKSSFDTASLYCLGYVLDGDLGDGIKRAVRAQVFSYQDDAELVADGDFYRGTNFAMSVSKDKSKAYAVYFKGETAEAIRFCGVDAHNLYHVRELNKTFSGAALAYHGVKSDGLSNGDTVSFHLRQVVDYE